MSSRKQRQKALDTLANDTTDVVEWPCYWCITQEAAQTLVARGRQREAACYSLFVRKKRTRQGINYLNEDEPHPLWATAACWEESLKGAQLLAWPIH